MALTYKPKKIIAASKVAEVIPNNKPVIFWDTCMLIYIISLAVRNSFAELESYNQILTWIENNQVTSVTSSIVWEEYTQHFAENKAKAEDDQNKLKTVLKSYADCIGEPKKSRISDVIDLIDLVTILEDIEKRIWQNTYVIKDNANLRNNAHFRVLHKMSLSKKKDQYKDSLIWVTFLQMASTLPSPLFEVYVTANKEDFCVNKSPNPQNEIKNDCQIVKAEICVELKKLVNLITRELGRG